MFSGALFYYYSPESHETAHSGRGALLNDDWQAHSTLMPRRCARGGCQRLRPQRRVAPPPCPAASV
ncbi:hypothetical protein KCP76_23235 [Salmonella enterica subsp. enterica serovar Weltevreden]|nr:hypothetical protein KCP76_23235 [Salmonella enterica subsp. enterica serovar Weltevreden]